MISVRFSILALAVAMISGLWAQPPVNRKQVTLPQGQNSITQKGTLKGDAIVDYMLAAKGGERFRIELQAGGSTYFNVTAPGADQALFIGSTSGRTFEGGLDKAGEYTIRVYQMRSSARRGAVSNYSITFRRLSGFVAAAGETGPAKYNAKGMTRCSAGNAGMGSQCEFRVVRQPGGKAEIWLQNPAAQGKFRVLYFQQGDFTTNDGAKVVTKRQSDDFVVVVNGNEHYTLPDAMITGG